MIKLQTYKEYQSEKGPKYLLHHNLSDLDPPRDVDLLHASELTYPDKKFCPRERAFLLKYGDNRPDQFLGTALSITFQVGRWYEHMVRSEWLRKYAFGPWQCNICGNTTPYQMAPKKCTECGAKGHMDYVEPRIWNPEYEVGCGIDFLFVNGGRIRMTELKSMEKVMFKDIKAPIAEHRIRTQLYMFLIAGSDWMDQAWTIDLDFSYLLYMSKGHGATDYKRERKDIIDSSISPFKEFVIEPTKRKTLKPYLDDALAVKKFRHEGVMPPRTVCPTINCTRAEQCTYRKECFSEA